MVGIGIIVALFGFMVYGVFDMRKQLKNYTSDVDEELENEALNMKE